MHAADNECPCSVYELPVSIWLGKVHMSGIIVSIAAVESPNACSLVYWCLQTMWYKWRWSPTVIYPTDALMVNVVIQPTMVEDVPKGSAVTPTLPTA